MKTIVYTLNRRSSKKIQSKKELLESKWNLKFKKTNCDYRMSWHSVHAVNSHTWRFVPNKKADQKSRDINSLRMPSSRGPSLADDLAPNSAIPRDFTSSSLENYLSQLRCKDLPHTIFQDESHSVFQFRISRWTLNFTYNKRNSGPSGVTKLWPNLISVLSKSFTLNSMTTLVRLATYSTEVSLQ